MTVSITHAPNLMWGTDGVPLPTTAGADPRPPSSIGTPSVPAGMSATPDRFAAAVRSPWGLPDAAYGSTAAGAGSGAALRMDHGIGICRTHFTNQIKFWGIQPSYALPVEPQANGVAERFNRTPKVQIIHGRIYRRHRSCGTPSA